MTPTRTGVTSGPRAQPLLTRRWPERRAVVLAGAGLLPAALFAATRAVLAGGVLAVLPVTLVALELGGGSLTVDGSGDGGTRRCVRVPLG